MQNSQRPDRYRSAENPNAGELTLSLSNCDREPIHMPGSIQPHGYLIGIAPDGEVLSLSSNIKALSGREAEELLHDHLNAVIGEKGADTVLEQLAAIDNKKHFRLHIAPPDGAAVDAEAKLHKIKDEYILELEPLKENRQEQISLDFFAESMREFQEATSPEALTELAARKVKKLTGFDRVMVYRFKEDGSGEVIAEQSAPQLNAYLGLHFPASDIPLQARALYLNNPIRFIPDANYRPVKLVYAEGRQAAEPLDMSQLDLRSVSPVHLEYLHNMGVAASMSVSIVRDHQLWGLIACHHSAPHYISYQTRQMCELLGRSYSMLVGEKERLVLAAYKDRIEQVKEGLFQHMSKVDNFVEGLHRYEPNARQLIDCGGCVLSFGDDYISMGLVPLKEQVQALCYWLQKNVEDDVFYTDQLPELFPESEAWRDKGCGILAIAISKLQQEYIIWFRPEQVEEINWAGREQKEIGVAGAEPLLSPRKSFEVWTEQVSNKARPWIGLEIEAARALRSVIVDIVLRISGELKLRADILSRINIEMESDRDELESFAYIAAHDLKEPLRGIHHYTSFVLEDYRQILDEAGNAKLQTILRLSNRMQQLIDSLLQITRIGRLELEKKSLPMKKLIDEVLDVFRHHQSSMQLRIIMPEEWPVISCDELRVSEVFMNLISNALKYSNEENKIITIGYRKAVAGEISPSGFIFFVQDNGLGIEDRHLDKVFHLFRRLHGRAAYGGGTGAGLAITKKIVERHGGQIWVESEPGKGSCFYFSL